MRIMTSSGKGVYPTSIPQLALIIITGIVAYANSFTVPLQFDDHLVLGAAYNTLSRGIDGFLSPEGARWVVDATFALNRTLNGFRVGGYHLLNLAIHLTAALTVFGLVRTLLTMFDTTPDTPRSRFSAGFIPFATALLFVCHPIQTQAVTYIAQRYTSLAGLLYLFAIFSFLKARRTMELKTPPVVAHRERIWWAAFIVSTLLAMNSKQISITLPIMAALLEMICFQGRLLRRPLFMLLLAGLLAVIPLHILSGNDSLNPIVQSVETATAETTTISRYSYLLTQQRVGVTYLRLLLFPVNQNLDYDYPLSRSLMEWRVLASILLHLALILLAVRLLYHSGKRHTPGASPHSAPLQLAGVGILWFYLTLSVESSLIPIRDVIFEHRLYLPSVGLLMALSSMIGWLLAPRERLHRIALTTVIVLAAVLTAATVARNRIWGSELSMWRDVLAKSPNKSRARFNAGVHFAKRMQMELALPNFIRAIELEPDNEEQLICMNHAITSMIGDGKRVDNGMQYQATQKSVRPESAGIWAAISRNNLGVAYEHLGNLQLAQRNYTIAVTMNPGLESGWYNLALLAARQGNRTEYVAAAGRLTALNPQLGKQLPPFP